ncbi:MAG: hypothetical protein HRT38_04330 [Alteromonadaceae bacterium]|nr:hypothetical protein [Alteromonadaceae bacterium]
MFDTVLGAVKKRYFSIVAKSPTLLSYLYGKRALYTSLVVSRNTDIVIEGFPRSANTFAIVAFEQAQSSSHVIAHHLHAEAQFLLAIKYKIPAIALIREPVAAVSSLLIRDKSYTATQALQRYIDFYSLIDEISDYVVLADFSKVITNYGEIITECNDKFGQCFDPFSDSGSAKAEVFELIKKLNLETEHGDSLMIAIPDDNRSVLNEEIKKEVESNHLIYRAKNIYNKLTNAD